MSGLPERLAREAVSRCLLAAATGSLCEPCVALAIRQALDEAAQVARKYADGGIDDFEIGAALNIAVAIEALK